MEKQELRNAIVKVLDMMHDKAVDMGITGVGVAAILNAGEENDWIGEMKIVGEPCNIKENWNLVAIAWSKAGEVIASGKDSGDSSREKMLGEFCFTGGAYGEHKGCKLAFAFSGALPEEDYAVAEYGIEKFKEMI